LGQSIWRDWAELGRDLMTSGRPVGVDCCCAAFGGRLCAGPLCERRTNRSGTPLERHAPASTLGPMESTEAAAHHCRLCAADSVPHTVCRIQCAAYSVLQTVCRPHSRAALHWPRRAPAVWPPICSAESLENKAAPTQSALREGARKAAGSWPRLARNWPETSERRRARDARRRARRRNAWGPLLWPVYAEWALCGSGTTN